MPKVAIIILNYNNCADTAECLRTLTSVNTAPARLIVVDNASRPDERQALIDLINSQYPQATLVLSDTNLGYARGNNLGLDVAYADPEVDNVLILNNDIVWTADILPALIERQQSLPDCGIISPVLYKADGVSLDINCARRNPTLAQLIRKNLLHYWWRSRHLTDAQAMPGIYLLGDPEALSRQQSPTLPVELPSGSCMLIDKELMRGIGGFDPNTFLYYEENILYKKLAALGKRNYVCLDLSCIHLGAATTSAMPSSLAVMRHSIKSAKYYLRAYSGTSLPGRAAYAASAWFMINSFKLQKALSKKK